MGRRGLVRGWGIVLGRAVFRRLRVGLRRLVVLGLGVVPGRVEEDPGARMVVRPSGALGLRGVLGWTEEDPGLAGRGGLGLRVVVGPGVGLAGR
jgi:hypothetical protein